MRKIFADTLDEFDNRSGHMENECEKFGSVWGCKSDCPVFERGECDYNCTDNCEKCDFPDIVLSEMSERKNFIQENAVDEGYLYDWYIHSVTDEPPVWTEGHIAEVYNDFYMIPREVVEKL